MRVDEGSGVSAVRVVRVAIVAVTVVFAGASAACSSPSTGTATARPRPTVSVRAPVQPTLTGPSLAPNVLAPGQPMVPSAVAPPAIPPPPPALTSPPTPTTVPTLSKVVLASYGFGALRLGMTAAEAQTTHLVGTASLAPGETCPTGRLLAAPSGGTPSLFFSPSLGLVAIYAYPGITTPAGIKVGSALADLRRAYPTWRGLQGDEGVGYVAAPGSTTSEYRIAVSNGHVIELAIQLDDEDCYE
jgi:hypothetical protein